MQEVRQLIQEVASATESVMAITSHFKLKAIVDRASMHINRRDSEQ